MGRMRLRDAPLAVGAVLALAWPAVALEPKDVFLVANKNVPASKGVAEHYALTRGVPADQIVVLDLPTDDDISRVDYDARLAGPLRAVLAGRRAAVKVLLTVYGVPLRVGRHMPTPVETAEADRLRPELDAAGKRPAQLEKDKAPPSAVAEAVAWRNALDFRIRSLVRAESHASVDSELMCLWWGPYRLDRWAINPLYFRISAGYRAAAPPTLLTARLDGPTPEAAKRLVDDAVAVEARGLAGTACIDARGLAFSPTKADPGIGYGGYDESMRETARLLERAGLSVLLDDKPELLPAGAAKDVAMYCGWYSHGKFVDCCAFAPGAVAWHLASSEAVSLHDPNSTLWCPNLLKKGVAATLGPVAEPYTFGFPKPAEFFGFLATGELTLVECYARSMLFCSWMTVLIGDPLYTPYKKNPKLKAADVLPSPKGGTNPVP